MASVNLTTNFSTVTDKVIIVWYESSAPLAEVGRRVVEPPHSQDNYSYTGLNPVVHIFKFYSSTDGTTLQTLLPCTFVIDASLINVPLVELLEFKVGSGIGDAPADGATQYVNTDLDSADISDYVVNKPGFGLLSFTENINKISGGGFEFIDGSIFSLDEVYILTLYKIVAQQEAEIQVASQFTDIEVITINIDFDSTHYDKLMVADLTEFGLIALPDFATIPNNKTLNLITHSSSFGLKIECAGSDTIAFMGEDRTGLYILPGEQIRIIWKDGVAYVFHYEGSYKRLGQRIWGDKVELNTLALDGSEYLITEHPRLYHDFIQTLDAGQIVSYATWATSASVTIAGNVTTIYPNKGLYAVSDDGLSFKLPDMRNMFIRGMKYLDGTTDAERQTQAVGGLQHQQIISHSHPIPTKNGGGSGGPDWAGATISGGTANTSAVGGTETRPDNIGLIPLIIE
jgi:hypothetical protein